jgi:hypothetical protein
VRARAVVLVVRETLFVVVVVMREEGGLGGPKGVIFHGELNICHMLDQICRNDVELGRGRLANLLGYCVEGRGGRVYFWVSVAGER